MATNHGDATSVPPNAHDAVAVPDLATMTTRARAIALAYFEVGRVEGIAAGRAQVEAELAAEWRALREECLPRLRSMVPHAELSRRRGQHARAEQQERTLRERGVWPVVA